MMTMCDGILSCPFCGGDNLFVDTELDYEMRYVTCLDCDAFGPVASKLPNLREPFDGPIDAWNTRTERTCTLTDKRWDNGACVWGVECSECGTRFEHETGGCWRYCPSCGAKVVS